MANNNDAKPSTCDRENVNHLQRRTDSALQIDTLMTQKTPNTHTAGNINAGELDGLSVVIGSAAPKTAIHIQTGVLRKTAFQ